MSSPYLTKNRNAGSQEYVMTASGDHIRDALKIRPGSNERMIGRNSEINASSKGDLMHNISSMIDQYQRGTFQRTAQIPSEVQAARRELLVAAINDRNGDSWQVLGEALGDEIWETLGREGFARKTLLVKPLLNGEVGRLRIRRKDVVALVSTEKINVVESQVRQNYVYPGEFYINANIRIETKEIAQTPGDLLEEKYQDGLEQVMVAEDKVWKTMADRAANTYNKNFLFNTFTPIVFATMQNEVQGQGIPVETIILAYNVWPDIVADTEFHSWFSEIAKHEIVLQGQLGTIMGAKIITDAFRYETLKVLDQGELYFCGPAQTLGGITQRQELTVSPIDGPTLGIPEKGWFMSSIEGMSITNSRALAKGKKTA